MMARFIHRLRKLREDTKGAAIVEFALTLPVLAVFLMGTFDIGYSVYMRSIANGTLQKAARRATVEGVSGGNVDSYIRTQLTRILPKSQRANAASVIAITKTSYNKYSNVGVAEKLTTDNGTPNVLDVGDCYEDANNNNNFDTSGGISGLGGSDDVVYYDVTITVPRVFPLNKLIGGNANTVIKAKTAVRNQPYGTQAIPASKCRTV